MTQTYKTINKEEFTHCPECKGFLIQNNHELVCTCCGMVVDDLILTESYQFNETKNSDLGSGDQYVSLGKTVDNIFTLGSHIDYYHSTSFYDINGRAISPRSQKQFCKFKTKYSLRIKIKNRETDYRILKILNQSSESLQLSQSVKHRAAYFYHAIKKSSDDIKNHVSLIGFCIYYASREFSQNSPVSIKELCTVFNSHGHRINSKLIIRDSIAYQRFIKVKYNAHKSEDYLPKLVNSIILHPDLYSRMLKKGSFWSVNEYQIKLYNTSVILLKNLSPKARGSRNPYILAGAIVYCADKVLAKEYNSKTILTQKIASLAMKIPEYSIRDHFVKVLKPSFSHILVSDE